MTTPDPAMTADPRAVEIIRDILIEWDETTGPVPDMIEVASDLRRAALGSTPDTGSTT